MSMIEPCPWCGAVQTRAVGQPMSAPCLTCGEKREAPEWRYEVELFNRGTHLTTMPVRAASADLAHQEALRIIARSHIAQTGRVTHFAIVRVDTIVTRQRLSGGRVPTEVMG